MSDWFRFLPHAIDSVANAVKVRPTNHLYTPAHHFCRIQFQQESLAALVRHYRNQCLQLSATCDRLRHERRSLRKDTETLRRELHLCRSRGSGTDQAQEPSGYMNHNGKRPLADVQGQNSSVKTNSSPRSIPTPVGPLRLTLPPGEHPTFSRQEPSGQGYTIDRPGSSRFAQQYAYHGEDNSRVGPSHPTNGQQSASVRQPQLLHINHGMMAPPPPPSQGKRSRAATTRLQTEQSMETAMSQDLGPQRTTEISNSMGPPPTPQRPFSAALRTSSRVPTHNATHQTSSALQTNRFIPNSSHNRTFSGFTPAVTSTGTTPAGNVGKASGGNRMPFMPQSSSGLRR
ncbi:hypothetical protein L210DRAFT_3527018 [Boletus edulis BED1]|uniref:Uncharacterized protein n=1 Tax=Boletus edulis BED1 TaxID=1328754 RepID=A0AAD4C479_BOLED|nr:hypothetical protein L210DRAFT_3527018 [Boletus edulis BED1]